MKVPGRLVVSLVVLMALVLTFSVSFSYGAAQPASPEVSAPPAVDAAAVDIRVNCGGPNYTDSQGKLWLADHAYAPSSWGFEGGQVYTNTAPIQGTVDDPLYQSQHSNMARYRFDVTNNGLYEVELRFAEIYPYNYDTRKFHVDIEGIRVLTDFTPWAYYGATRYAVNATFVVPVTDNQVTIDFIAVTNVAIINAIRVTSLPTPPEATVLRFNAGGLDYTDSQGNVWVADQKYITGTHGYVDPPLTNPASTTYLYASAIANTSDPELFQRNRFGMLGYSVDLPAGSYRVDLLFAELYFQITGSGQRVFDVFAEGELKLANVDVYREAGGKYKAITKTLEVNLSDQQLNLTFTKKPTVTHAAIINAIAIRPLDSAPPGPWSNFAPTGWVTTSQRPPASVQVIDTQSGLNVSSGEYAISTNGGSTFSAWQPATVSGSSGTTGTQTISIAQAPFDQDSATQNKIRFRVRDTTGNLGDSPAYTVQVDALPPSSLITSPVSGTIVSGPTALIQGTASDAASGVQAVEISSDGGTVWTPVSGTSSWSYTWPVPGEGVYYLRSWARDGVGHVETPGTPTMLAVDRTPPATFIRFPAGGDVVSTTTVVITGTAFDAASGVARVEVSLNNGSTWAAAAGTTPWSFNWTPLAQGSYTIRARAVDRAGYVDDPGAAVNVFVDQIAPTSAISDPLAGRIISSTMYTILGVANDNLGGSGLAAVEVSTDGATWHTASGLSTWSYTWNPVTGDGFRSLRSRARDLGGNVQAVPASVDVLVDRTPPASDVSISGTAGSGGWYRSAVNVGLMASDTASGVRAIYYSLDGAGYVAYTAPIVISSDGVHTVSYYGIDQAGNVEPSHTVFVSIDTVAPMSSLSVDAVSGQNGWYLSSPMITLAAADTGSAVKTVYYRVDVGPWLVYFAPFQMSANGGHVIAYYAEDEAGNQETIHSVAVNIDSVAPATTHTVSGVAGNNGWYKSTPSITLASSDATSGVHAIYYRLDGASWQTYAAPVVVTSDGSHIVSYYAVDAAGNGEASHTFSLLVDAHAPNTTIVSPYHGQIVRGPQVVISGTAEDPHSGVVQVEISLNGGGNWAPATLLGDGNWVYTWTVSSDGDYVIRSRSTDGAGNLEAVGPGNSVQVDSTASLSLITTPANGQYIRSTNVVISGTASDAGSGVKRVEVSVDGGAWNVATGTDAWRLTWTPVGGDGQHSVRSRATDNAGNVEIPGSGITFFLDNGSPVSTITMPANGQVITTPVVSIAGTSSDALSTVKRVDVSLQRSIDGFFWDGGSWVADETWLPTAGTTASWSYLWTDLPIVGMVTIRSRAVDVLSNAETPGDGVAVILRRGYIVAVPLIMSDY